MNKVIPLTLTPQCSESTLWTPMNLAIWSKHQSTDMSASWTLANSLRMFPGSRARIGRFRGDERVLDPEGKRQMSEQYPSEIVTDGKPFDSCSSFTTLI